MTRREGQPYQINAYTWPDSKETLTYSFKEGGTTVAGDSRSELLGLGLDASARTEVRNAMDAWEAVCGVRFVAVADSAEADIRFAYAPTSSTIEGGASDGPGGTLGTSWTWYAGSVTDVVAVVLDQVDMTSGTQVWDTTLHELGHALGIDHSDTRDVVMSGLPATPYSNQPGRDQLRADDIEAAQRLWGPAPHGAPPPTSPSGPGPGHAPHPPSGGDGPDDEDEPDDGVEPPPVDPPSPEPGTPGDDTILGFAGDDSVAGGAGDDALLGRAGDDTLSGGEGNDTLWGEAGNDSLEAGAGHDLLFGQAGDDHLDGGGGVDNLLGGDGADTLHGGAGPDGLWGEAGADTLSGDGGADFVAGGAGNDTLDGGDGADYLAGGEGADTLDGGAGYDILAGGEGDDRLMGGAEGDTFFGQAGADTFVIRGGTSWIMDFDDADRLDIGMTLAQVQATATQLGDHLLIELRGGGDLYLANTTLAEIDADNLIV